MCTASCVRKFRAACSIALAALVGALALPLLEAALANASAPFCCSRGRCCCAGETAAADERPCLRRGCACERPEATLAGAPLVLEAVLPAIPSAHPEPRSRCGTTGCASMLSCPHAPPVPPPRRASPA